MGNRDHDEEFQSGWAHNGGLPIALSIKEGNLLKKPIREIYSLKDSKLLEAADISFELANYRLLSIREDNFYLKVETDARCIDIFISDYNR